MLDVCGVGAAAAAGERAAVTRSRQLAAPAHCTQLSTAAAGGGRELTAAAEAWGGAHCSSCSWGGGGQLLGPGASAPTAASHQPTGENIILIRTMMGQSLIHNQKFPSHGNICFNDNIKLKHYFIEISLPYPNSSRLWKIY